MIKMDKLTQKRLKELFSYDPDTGDFIRLKAFHKAYIGTVAGGLNACGYRRINIGQKYYTCHRLAFLYMTGKWPLYQVDHINHIRYDNRWANLRDVPQCENCKNTKIMKNNVTGFNEVHFISASKMFGVSIRVNGKLIYLGAFKNRDNAIEVRKKTNTRYRFHEKITETLTHEH